MPNAPEDWLITFDDFKRAGNRPDPNNEEGRPFGDGTEMAKRAKDGKVPWDDGCEVQFLNGGWETMNSIRGEFFLAKNDALNCSNPLGQRGHVYISGWRLNANRIIYHDMTTNETVWDWISDLMNAGVKVRILLWLPLTRQQGFGQHIDAHFYLARLVEGLNGRLRLENPTLAEDLGVVFLDTRVAEGSELFASHHQKFIVIRGLNKSVAFCGGIDLAYTRRDLPSAEVQPWFGGDHQSGDNIPTHNEYIEDSVDVSDERQGDDLFAPVYGSNRQIWHDQHLRLEGPIVGSLEEIFRVRWKDASSKTLILQDDEESPSYKSGTVISSSENALTSSGGIVDLPEPTKPAAVGSIKVQAWQTIPLRIEARSSGDQKMPYSKGEFSFMAGLVNASKQAKELIMIFDQYFWDNRYANLLAKQLIENNDLHLIVFLPPHSDQSGLTSWTQHRMRRSALSKLPHDRNRVKVFSLWNFNGSSIPLRDRGIYCHAKAQVFDDALLVCGSSNINRRSLECDTELSCAVFDQDFVRDYYVKIWRYLFYDDLPSNINFDVPHWGKTLFEEITNRQGNFIEDPWRDDPPNLPNDYTRKNSGGWGHVPQTQIIDPSSLPIILQSRYYYDGRLDEIIDKIERQDESAWRLP